MVLALVGAACGPVFGAASGPVRRGTLSSDSGGQLSYSGDDTTVTAHPHATGADASVGGEPVQSGIAMRITQTGEHDEGNKAITVTEHVWQYGVWIFNVHVWDSTDATNPFTLVGQFDLNSIVGKFVVDENGDLTSRPLPPPWSICAQTQADQISFRVWTRMGNRQRSRTSPRCRSACCRTCTKPPTARRHMPGLDDRQQSGHCRTVADMPANVDVPGGLSSPGLWRCKMEFGVSVSSVGASSP